MSRTTGLTAASVAEYALNATRFVVGLEDGGFASTAADVSV
jgi:hypothetical protein